MFEAYKVGVTLSLTNKVSAGLLLIGKDLARTQGSVAALQAKLDKMKETGKKAAYELGAAFAIAAPFAVAITDAARLQKEMIGIQQATGATTRQINDMRVAIEKVAGQTMFSNIDVAKMAKTIGTGTQLKPGQITDILPIYARFADVQLLLKGTPAQQSVAEAVRLAHTAQHYDPASLAKYLDLLNRLSMVIPGGLGEAGHALKYSQSVAKTALGVDDENMVEMIALLNQLGFAGSRGGTNALAAMTRSIPGIFGSGLLKGRSAEALMAMGMSDASGHATFFRDGKFNTHVWMQQLSAYVAKEFASHPEALARQAIMKNFQFALGVNGARVATILSSPQALDQLLAIQQKFQALPNVKTTQGVFATKSVYQQFENVKTNFTSLMTEIGYTLLPATSKALKSLNSGLMQLIEIVHDNPKIVRDLSLAFMGLSASLAFAGTVNLLKFAFMGLSIPLALFRGALMALLCTPFGLIVAGIGIVVTTGYYVYKHWDSIKPKLLSVWSDLKSWINGILDWVSGKAAAIIHTSSIGTTGGSWANGNRGFAPPPRIGNPVQVHTQVNLDGRQIANVVSDHQYHDMNRDLASGGAFDGRLSFASPGVP